MSKFFTAAILAAAVLAGNLATTANARPNGRGEQSKTSSQQNDDARAFWKKMQRYGN